jgi:hypothetical protein
MALNKSVIAAATYDSWNALHVGKPHKSVQSVEAQAPEILAAHSRMVESLLSSGCDPEKAIRRVTDGRQGLKDCLEESEKFIVRLAAYLKVWATKKRIEPT